MTDFQRRLRCCIPDQYAEVLMPLFVHLGIKQSKDFLDLNIERFVSVHPAIDEECAKWLGAFYAGYQFHYQFG